MQRKQFTTTIREDYLKKIKILAIEKDKRVNDILEEAIEWLMVKYAKQSPENWKSGKAAFRQQKRDWANPN